MSLARYSYLAWLRRGAANAITVPATTKSRADVRVSLAVNDGVTTGAPIEKDFKLMGPGDVIGLNSDLVVRTEPRAWVTDFEPNHFAFVEFYDEDFPWRHTPALADPSHRLTPWISLLVLAESEFDRNLVPGRPLTSVILKATEAASFFPPDDQLWAWAHVQIVGEIVGDGAPDLAQLQDRLAKAPDSGVSRLVSPRGLDSNTPYYAFVVPTFEVGRKAGLGLKIDDDTESGMALSWRAGAIEFPVYFEWYFRTSEGGDFEDLVERITARPINPRVGVRDIDIAAPGFGMPVVAEALGPGDPPSHHRGVVGLEGALKAPTMEPKPLDPTSTFPQEASKIVNAPAIAQADGDSDPIVAPPLIGGWHALVDRVDPAARPAWVHDLNLDPRERAAGGLGARVIRANQERYMKLAWEQVGEVLAANRRAAFLRFAQAAVQKSFVKHVRPLSADRALALTAPMFARVLGSPKTLRGLLSESRIPDAAMSPAFRKLTRPRGLAMRRALPRNQRAGASALLAVAVNDARASAAPPPPPVKGPTLNQIADAVAARHANAAALVRWSGWVIALLTLLAVAAFASASVGGVWAIAVAASFAAAAVGVFVAAQRARTTVDSIAKVNLSRLTPETVAKQAPAQFALTAPGVARAASFDRVAAADFGAALRDFAGFIAARPAPQSPRPRFDISKAHAEMMRTIAPSASFPKRAASLIRIGDRSIIDYVREVYATPPNGDVAPPISPVLAYPDIKEPMYSPLKALADELLVPNLGLVPPNTISLMLTNPPFIEAYLAGANHEFARELLWREYPTDCRGSPFRQFWDVSNTPTPGLDAVARARKLKDIKPLHEWAAAAKLGENPNPERGVTGVQVVLVLRGDLLKRYPNTIVYAQRARWSPDPRHVDELALYDEEGTKALADVEDPNLAYPIFTAVVAPDLTFIGFNLDLEEVRGDPALDETAEARASIPANKLGWFFVLQEVVGEPRLGLDERAPPATMQSDVKWENLAWSNLNMTGRKLIDLAVPFVSEPQGGPPSGEPLNWAPSAGATAADLAAILYQKPVMVAWHARQMLERGKVD
jgi:hypothetical protein